MIKVDISNVWGEVALPDLLALEPEVAAAHQTLTEGTGAGNAFLGWLHLPVSHPTDELRRISAAAAVMGELMGIRPIITLIDGKTKVEGKVRGDDKVVPAMIELCKKRAGDVEDFDYMIGHTNIPQKDDLIKACRKAFGKDPLITFPLGGVVSANTGPDTIALVYVGHAR